MGQTIVEKIAKAHLAEGPDRPLRAGDFLSIRPRHVMTHDNTSAVMKKFQGIGAKAVKDPRQPVFALDHDIQNQAPDNLGKYRRIEAFAKEQGIDFYPAGSGIGHQLMVERGYAVPGSLVVASDSHSNMYGAMGAIGTPVVRTDAAAIWATGEFWWQVPRTVQVVLKGALRPGVSGKDVIMALCGLYNREEVLNAALEFVGPGVASLSLDARLTIANMTTEWGALTGWFPVDGATLAFLAARAGELRAQGIARIAAADLQRWEMRPPAPDPDAVYAATHHARPLAGRAVRRRARPGPGDGPAGRGGSAADRGPQGLPAVVRQRPGRGSGRRRRGAEGEEGRPRRDALPRRGQREVQRAAEASGEWQALVEAGAVALPPSCGPCIGLGEGLLEAGEVGISATNRNFKGRMGSRDAHCYLASPAVVAASAAAGTICGPGEMPRGTLARDYRDFPAEAAAPEAVEILDGFPAALCGRLVFLPQDNLNTDGIYGKDYTYREDMTREMMAGVVMENYDPEFGARTRPGDVLVGGFNFGTGSSREQAVTALQAKGIPLVIAGSFSQTYLRNAFNNGFPCVENPDFPRRLAELFGPEIAQRERTILPGDEVEIDYRTGVIRYRGETFAFPALGSVPQSLVVAGGIENLVARKLGLA